MAYDGIGDAKVEASVESISTLNFAVARSMRSTLYCKII